MNIPDFFYKKAREHLEKSAFIIFDESGRREVSYEQFIGLAIDFAGHLSGRLSAGERVLLFAENRHEWCSAYLGIVSIGCVAVPLDAELGTEEVTNICRTSGAAIAICSDRTIGRVKEAGFDDRYILNLDKLPPSFTGSADFDLGPHISRIGYDDLASIIFTSGTTGVPKGVMLTHRNFCSDAMAVIQTGLVTAGDNVLAVLPLHHTYAFMCTFLVPLLIGGTVTYPASLKGPDIAHAIKEGGATIMIGVPQLLDLFYSAIMRNIESLTFLKRAFAKSLVTLGRAVRERTGFNIGKLLFRSVHERFGRQFRLMTSGGASLSPETMRGLEAFGFTVLEGYGLTETSPVVTFNPIEKRKPGSVGIPLNGVEIRIERRDGDDENVEGEVVVKGQMVMKGYYKMPDETERVVRDGWFYTGDLGYLDEDGYLFLTGRRKEVIVLPSGKNIYPEEIEKAYLGLSLVKEICVLARGERDSMHLHAVVVPDFDHARAARIANIHEALKWDIHGVSLGLPSYMRIRGFTLHAEPLPRTRLGKLRRFEVRKILDRIDSAERKKGEKVAEPLDEFSRKVVECVARFVPDGQAVGIGDNLELDLGIDSLKRIELAVELEKTFGVDLSGTFMVDVQTVAEIRDRLSEMKPETTDADRAGKKTFRDILMKTPDEAETRAIGLEQGFLTGVVVWAALRMIRLFYRVYFGARAEGVEKLPEPPFIIAANHASYLDSFFIGSHVPFRVYRDLFFQGAQKYFETGLMKLFARLAHVIPIDPDAYMASAFSLSAFVLRQKKSLCIFPEGGRSFDGEIMPFRKGVGVLASELGVPIVPVRIRGTYESMPRGRAFPRRTKLSLTIGEPVTVEEIEKLKSEGADHYQAVAEAVQKRVEAL